MSGLSKINYDQVDNLCQPVREIWQFNNDEVIVCIDVECHCFNQTSEELKLGIVGHKRRVCEVGFTVLDTKDIANIQPGDRFDNVWTELKSYSLSIKEHVHEKTGKHTDWCKVGCAEDFLFGTTQWISKTRLRDTFVSIMNHYTVENPSQTQSSTAVPRPVVSTMFGGSDMTWLRNSGLDLKVEYPTAQFFDIQRSTITTMLEVRLMKPNISALDLFTYLGIQTQKTHNGGNDAVYEMQAFLASFAMTREQWRSISLDRQLPLLTPIWEVLEDERPDG